MNILCAQRSGAWPFITAWIGLFGVSAIASYSYANTEAATRLISTVTAVCGVSAPAAVDLGEIPLTAFSGKTTGDNLDAYAVTFQITPSCTGTANYQLTFTPASRGGSCVGSDTGTLRFCLRAGSSDLDFSGSGNPAYSGTGSGAIAMTVMPQYGAYTPKAEVVTGSLTVTISPR